MKKPTLLLAICLAIFLTACGAGNKPAAETKSETEKINQNETASSGSMTDITGVAACDEYLSKVEKFSNNPNVPQATRDAYKQTSEQNRTAWKQAALTPQGKAQLETSCKTALDSFKTALDQYGN